jgi:hypothetical protein
METAGIRQSLEKWFGGHRLLGLAGLACAGLAGLTFLGVAVDPRQLLGVSVWLKPAKFLLSFAIYLPTVAWLFGQLRGWPRLRRWLSRVTVTVTAIEMAAIAGQAARGVRSHFNIVTAFDRVVTITMGVAIGVLAINMLVLLGLVMLERHEDPVIGEGIRAGMVLLILGFAAGAPMLRPTPEQSAFKARTGQRPPVIGSHTLGAPEGGPGLPLMNWSTVAGDPRAAHFIGMHGLQALPLLAVLLGRRLRRRTVAQKIGLIWAAAFGWGGVTTVLLVQALRHQPITSPEAWTLAGFLATAVVTALLVLRAVRPAPATELLLSNPTPVQ